VTPGECPAREEALALLHEWVESPALRRHCRCVESAMRAYARKFAQDEERWAIAGLIHDFDWERHPSADLHPMAGVAILRERGWPDDVCRAVLGHATHSGVPRDTLMARTLFACDELCGFLVACSLVLPDRSLAGVEVASVRKKLKRADFARNVSRDDIVNGAAELGVDLDEHVAFVLGALKDRREELGL
jgi:predicted hydrolase (HD superfamily)